MSPDTAMSTPVYGMSDRALAEAHALLGSIKRQIRRQFDWRPTLAMMEEAYVIPSRGINDAHRGLVDKLRPYNVRIDDLLAEMIRRQTEASQQRNKNRRPTGEGEAA